MHPSGPPHEPRAVALWPLPMAAGLLPAIATLVAWRLSIALDLIPACNPFTDGCVSISRAARHGLPNHLFRALVLPAALLQAATWFLCAQWLRKSGVLAGGRARLLATAGAAAGLFFILYGTFLGTEGDIYRWMRRFGIVFYFGLTAICLIVAVGLIARGAYRGTSGVGRHVAWLMVALTWGLLGIGLASAFSPLFLPDPQAQDYFTNALEWYGSALITAFFVVLALAWRRTGYVARLALSN